MVKVRFGLRQEAEECITPIKVLTEIEARWGLYQAENNVTTF